jgi:hypothetical protein
MTHPENGKPLWSESQVESLLEDFFRREMPKALREPSPAPTPHRNLPSAPSSRAPRTQTAKRRANSLAGLAMVGFSSLLMLMIAVMAWNPNPDPNPERHTNDSSSPESRSESHLEPDPLNQTKDGPIEMRSRLRNVHTGEEPGNESPAFPELDIEVYPLDRESPEKQREQPRPKNPERSPLPEENRLLPEAAPGEAIDPDEASIDPVLPELNFS